MITLKEIIQGISAMIILFDFVKKNIKGIGETINA
jgi:hypothetical protein